MGHICLKKHQTTMFFFIEKIPYELTLDVSKVASLCQPYLSSRFRPPRLGYAFYLSKPELQCCRLEWMRCCCRRPGEKTLVLRFSKMPNNPLTTEQTCPKIVGKAWEDLEFLHGYMAAKKHPNNLPIESWHGWQRWMP